MATSKAATVSAYLAELPSDRREALQAVREVIVRNLPSGFSEGMLYGMIGYSIPLAEYPHTYNGQPLAMAGLASHKGHLSLYLMSVYADPQLAAWFVLEHRKLGKELDMGKSCIRFRHPDDLSLPAVGEVIARVSAPKFIEIYEAARTQSQANKRSSATAAKRAAATV